MTGGIAHEFNNLLTPIMGYADLLMEELSDNPEAYENAQEIYTASEKAKDVITQISTLSRRNVETVFRTLEADRLLERVLKMMDSICPEDIRTEKHLACGHTCFLGNSTQITHVLLNLTVNAFHAIGDREGTVSLNSTVISREQLIFLESMKNTLIPDDWGRYIQISLKDDGCGMTPEVLRQCFTPFFTTKRAGEGTGLGLALAEQMILSHRGYIFAESVPDQGSIFYMFLPALDILEESSLYKKESEKEQKVLIADDNLKVLNLLEKAFVKHSVKAFTCVNKKKLLQILEAKQKGVISGYLLKPVSDRTIMELLCGSEDI